MLDMAFIDNTLHHFINNWAHYEEAQHSHKLGDAEAKELIPIAERTLAMVDGFLEIVDELNYDKEHFEELVMKLDDDYEQLRDFKSRLLPLIASHAKLAALSDAILDRLMQAQNRLGLRVLQREH